MASSTRLRAADGEGGGQQLTYDVDQAVWVLSAHDRAANFSAASAMLRIRSQARAPMPMRQQSDGEAKSADYTQRTDAKRMVTHQGRTQNASAWARELGITYHGLRERLRRGEPIATALSYRKRGRMT